MLIRQMQSADLQQVVRIEEDLFGDPWSEEAFRSSMVQPEARLLVAEAADGSIQGYCVSYRSLDEAEIVNVAVCRDGQNHGIGRRLVAQLMQEDGQNGVKNFILEVRISNMAARHVYEMLGFEEIGIRKHFYENPTEDAVIMCRENITTDA